MDDFFNTTIPNEVWYLNNILNGRFVLEDDDSIIFDTYRNIRTTFDFNKLMNLGRKSDYFKYEININTPIKHRRKIYLHKFIWMYHNHTTVPEGCSIVHKDDNIYNCKYNNLKIQYPRIENEDFFNKDIDDETWYYNQILQDRFEILDNGNKIYDKHRDKISTPGKFTEEDHNDNNTQKKLEYNIRATNNGTNNRKVIFHRLLWMIYNKQQIPKGYDIHHKDHNRRNNTKDNLECEKRNLHVKYHADNESDKQGAYISHMHNLKHKYMFFEKKLCNSCKRLLSFNHFYKHNDNINILKLSSWCKECASLKQNHKENLIYKFPYGELSDTIILDIRFKFHVMGKVFRSILHKYNNENITEDQLRDILLNNSYTHLYSLHGIKEYPFREKDCINRIEYFHILNSIRFGRFTLFEIAMMYKRPIDEIEYVITTGNYKDKHNENVYWESKIYMLDTYLNNR